MPNNLAQWKALFFDRKKVTDAADKGKRRAMIRYGAIVRKAAQRSMRYRKGPSKPGEPPSAHKTKRMAALKKMGRARSNGALLRELLFFAYHPASKSVVVGPVGFRTRGTPAPSLHEFGGSRAPHTGEAMLVKNRPGRDERGKFVSGGERLVRLKGVVRYPKRPFMAPALVRTVSKFADQFRGVIQ